MLRLVSLIGILVMLGLCLLLSSNRRAVPWRLVGIGLLAQGALGMLFLYWPAGNAALQRCGGAVKSFFDLAQAGNEFVFGKLADPAVLTQVLGPAHGFVFAFQVLPTLIFFSSFMAVLYHLGVMQFVVRGMAAVTARLLGTSGAESLSACANVFVGQTEAPLLVRPFLARMTGSELMAVMVGGFATIAGGVFVLYVGFGIDPGHLMVGSVMAVPAGLLCAKILQPETEVPDTMGRVVGAERSPYGNTVEAAAGGAADGLKLALNVGAMLIAFLGLLAVLNAALGLITPDLTIQRVLGALLYPVAAVMGVQASEIPLLAELLGTKLAATELVAYSRLGGLVESGGVSPRTRMIASFALCGFANFGSVAIQIGGLGVMAPERRGELARLGLRAMLGGALATCMTACIAGVLGNDAAS